MLVYIYAGIILMPLAYLYVLLFGGGILRNLNLRRSQSFAFLPCSRFFIAVAAHNEEAVIEGTVRRLKAVNYPRDRFDVYVVADHCADGTAFLARNAGAIVHQREDGNRGGKGAALAWLIERIRLEDYDAGIIFDADTRVDPNFLLRMNDRIVVGEKVIQGRHVISNPKSGWFAALTEAMFIIDNLCQNAGRDSLGLSAKLMGDSLCIASSVFKTMNWEASLTEDHCLRQNLVLAGYRVSYEERAIGCGEAPAAWGPAKIQRLRWMQGAHEVDSKLGRRLWQKALSTRSPVILDAALESAFPSYASLVLFLTLSTGLSLLFDRFYGNQWRPLSSLGLGGMIFAALFPFAALILARAPKRSFIALLAGPFFLIWRSLTKARVLLGMQKREWVRTPHGAAS